MSDDIEGYELRAKEYIPTRVCRYCLDGVNSGVRQAYTQELKFMDVISMCSEELLKNIPTGKIKEYRLNISEIREDAYETITPDEIMHHIILNYNGVVNVNLAKKVGMGILKVEGLGEYMYFTEGGMDQSPKLFAYQAIEFGFIEERGVERLQKHFNYFRYVLGEEVFQEFCRVLEIPIQVLNNP